jgi:hypothetical protein
MRIAKCASADAWQSTDGIVSSGKIQFVGFVAGAVQVFVFKPNRLPGPRPASALPVLAYPVILSVPGKDQLD